MDVKIITISDQKYIALLQESCDKAGLAINYIELNYGAGTIRTTFSEIPNDPKINEMLSIGSTMIRRITAIQQFSGNRSISIILQRQDGFDNLQFNFNDIHDQNIGLNVLIEFRKQFKFYDRTEILDKTITPELSRFYEQRDATLARLEELHGNILIKSEEYRKELENQFNARLTEREANYEKMETSLKEVLANREEELNKKEKQLVEERKQLDDRRSTHARREHQKQIKEQLKDRSAKFSLTRETIRKRYWVRGLFIVLLLATASSFGFTIFREDLLQTPTLIRAALSSLGFIGSLIYFIRWENQWAQIHADEEFRLKRLDLDIDRASWLVEMMLEWRDDKDAEIPPSLLEQLGRGLFEQNTTSRVEPTHPSHDLLSLLSSAAASFKFMLPGFGEVVLDRKGMNKAAKEIEKANRP